MNSYKKSFLTLGFFAFLVVSCTPDAQLKKSVTKVIEENPEIIFKAIEKDPEKFLMVVQKAAQAAKSKMAQQRQLDQQKQLQEAFDNPLKPEINETVASIGPDDAPIVLVEYSDFECPYCKKGSDTIDELKAKYAGKIKVVYKHLPLSFHPNAMPAAKYFEAIKIQSPTLAFKFHDEIFKTQSKLRNGEKFLKATARKIGANLDQLAKDINSPQVEKQIQKDIAEAKKFGIQGTPGFIINGIPVKGAYPTEHFETIIKKLEDQGKLVL